MNLEIVVLAAGKGTRMRSAKPKVLHRLAGKPLLQHVLDSSAELDPINITIVYGFGGDQVQREISADRLTWIEQREQKGTGHAVGQALSTVQDDTKILILYGDVPLTSTETLKGLLDKVTTDRSIAVLTCDLDDPAGYGRMVRNGDGNVVGIVEQKDATEAQKQIAEINTGIMVIPSVVLKKWIPELSSENAQGEYYLTDIIEMAAQQQIDIHTHQPASVYEIEGINSRSQLAKLERVHQLELCEKHMDQGVTFIDPARVDIRGDLITGTDITVDINVVFEGKVVLGDNVEIGPNCVIKDAVIGDNTQIHANSVIDQAKVSTDCSVGPFARLRPQAELAAGARVGNFVEVKKSYIGKGSKVNHLSYIGDATLGDRVNVGAGTITCNYDGKNKFNTIMEDDVFIGSNSALVAPVSIAKGSTVAAGSTITKDVPNSSLGIARAKQRNIEDWKKP
ncbi:MAG: bifunctional UDP-N-acetylglucosamine diphosphorylase/glucosamine-1-phosphate N-acetyltransferase GlmU [Pseudomonadales bacterium]|nr:bifunctional UDP-N-acetylglucosamine diphosphorylase/glucosamine-1-phosphate N-acetyltransferase GlmU [Pseudomonadales bacterium]